MFLYYHSNHCHIQVCWFTPSPGPTPETTSGKLQQLLYQNPNFQLLARLVLSNCYTLTICWCWQQLFILVTGRPTPNSGRLRILTQPRAMATIQPRVNGPTIRQACSSAITAGPVCHTNSTSAISQTCHIYLLFFKPSRVARRLRCSYNSDIAEYHENLFL
jgi:hypothetical protein